MKRIISFLAFSLLFLWALPAQTSADVKTLQCRFTQEKVVSVLTETGISKGMLTFCAPDKMRWEYTYPNKSGFILNGDRLLTLDQNGSHAQENANRLFSMIGSLILSGMDPTLLAQSKDFSVELSTEGKLQTITLVPARRDLKKFLSRIVINISTEDSLARKLEMWEVSGDKTTLIFSDHRINQHIDESLFQ